MKLDRIIAVRNHKTVYRDGELCMKVFDETYSKADILAEAMNQARVEETGLHIPQVREVTVIDGKWIIMTDYIKGKTLAQLMEEHPEKKNDWLNLFVDLQLEVQSKTCPLLPKLRDKMDRKISLTDFDATTRYELHTRLDSCPKHAKLCHGDFNPSNIIISALLTRDMQQLYVKLLKEGRVTESKTKGKSLSGSTVRAVHIHEEIARLLIQAKEEGFYELILLGLATGMRRGELLGLKWDDINFTTGELSIKREYTTLGSDYIISTPKTKSSVRSVHLPQSVLNILGEYRKTVNSEWVFPSPLDPTHPRSPTSCRSRLSDMLERAECNHIPFHGLRHIFSTMALENGLDIKTLSAVLGHSSAETTISVYSHVTGEMERNAAKKWTMPSVRQSPQIRP